MLRLEKLSLTIIHTNCPHNLKYGRQEPGTAAKITADFEFHDI